MDKEALTKIINIELNKLVNRLVEKNYKITFDESVAERIFNLNSNEEYGARPIKRIIQNLCEDFLSEEILKGNVKENKSITIKCVNELLLICTYFNASSSLFA